ncbi:MAG: PEP-CTERM system histidine kinase PrsK [Porphyrobacter sp.]|nr:PEP-CTERM system histidine kinase PrsK [Porphyrobacter sp.]
MSLGMGLESVFLTTGHVGGALLAGGAAVWAAQFAERQRPDRIPLVAALVVTAVWCVIVAANGAGAAISELAGSLRNLALLWLIERLFATDGRTHSLRPVRPLVIALVGVEVLHLGAVLALALNAGSLSAVAGFGPAITGLVHMLTAIGALLLLHNLYVGASPASQSLLRWSVGSLAAIYVFDLNLYALAYLGSAEPGLLIALRGMVAGLAAIGLAFGASAVSAKLEFRPSRAVTFHTLSLLVIGAYLALMALATKLIAAVGGDMVRTSQIAFLVLASLIAIVWLPSRSLRAWLKVKLAKHLFRHRYDYREEWLRFNRTVGRTSHADGESLAARAVKALADITESPAGLLLMPNEQAQLELTARWNWQTLDVPGQAGDYLLCGLLEAHGHIIALDEVRGRIDYHGEAAHVPAWLIEAEDAWALVPLVHFERLVGVIVLARPRIERKLDWEDFDLLKVVGQQLASYLAEQSGQEALMEATRFDEFNRRMAFVMHDIKNLASQLSLLAANAERHAENPAFRADMLVTLRNSSDKLAGLLARLGRYSQASVRTPEPLDLAAFAQRLAERYRVVHPVIATRDEPLWVLGDAEALEQALAHLVQNAIDASEPSAPVYLDVTGDGIAGQIEVIDAGCGMSPEFIRTGLFKPFVSSKYGGFGIGAYEARDLIKAMGGRVMVESREGVGTRFAVILPGLEAARLGAASALGEADKG